MAGRWLIAIASYRRPAGLRALLDSIATADGSSDADVLVVDNDPEGSARAVAAGHRLQPTYVVEPEPGIAAARNRALRHLRPEHEAIIFVDDDEQVAPDWLASLTAGSATTRADVVQGAVLTLLPPGAPAWIVRGGLLQRRVLPSGRELSTAATNNTLLRHDAWRRAGAPTFDPAFSASGGSDTDFFWGLRKAGARIVSCADAVVYEDVPAERLSLRWLRRRAIRNGIADTRVRRKHDDLSAAWLAGSLVRSVGSLSLLGAAVLTGGALLAKPFNDLFKSVGRVAALVDYRILEYARPQLRAGAPT